MDFSLCLNPASYTVENTDSAYNLMVDAFQGVLQLWEEDDRFFLYYEEKQVDACPLCAGFLFADFKKKLGERCEDELLSVILEIEDKAPLLDNITDDLFESLSELTVYIDDITRDESTEVFAFVWLHHGILLSMATHEKWNEHRVEIKIIRDYAEPHTTAEVMNISTEAHGDILSRELKWGLNQLCQRFHPVVYSRSFTEWYHSQRAEDKNKIREKIRYCCQNAFILRRPVTGHIKDSGKLPNLREIVVGAPVGQKGQIRVFFVLTDTREAWILNGFIKHDDDYGPYIRDAEGVYQLMSQN